MGDWGGVHEGRDADELQGLDAKRRAQEEGAARVKVGLGMLISVSA